MKSLIPFEFLRGTGTFERLVIWLLGSSSGGITSWLHFYSCRVWCPSYRVSLNTPLSITLSPTVWALFLAVSALLTIWHNPGLGTRCEFTILLTDAVDGWVNDSYIISGTYREHMDPGPQWRSWEGLEKSVDIVFDVHWHKIRSLA